MAKTKTSYKKTTIYNGTGALHYDLSKPFIVYNDPTNLPEGYEPVNVFDLTEETEELVRRFPELYSYAIAQDVRARNIVVAGGGNTRMAQMLGVANSLPNGPYYADGRDGKLTLHNEKVNRPVTKVYTYAGGNGELLEFKVSSKYSTSTVNLASRSAIDPDEKDQENEQTQVVSTQQSHNGELGWVLLPDNQRMDELQRSLDYLSADGVFRLAREGYSNPVFFGGKDKNSLSVYASTKKEQSDEEIKKKKLDKRRMLGMPLKASNSEDKAVRALADKLGDRRVFKSRQDAINHYTKNLVVTEQEVNDYIDTLTKMFANASNDERGYIQNLREMWGMGQQGLEEYFDKNHHFNGLIYPPFVIKRVITYYDVIDMDGKVGGVNLPGQSVGVPILLHNNNSLSSERRRKYDTYNGFESTIFVESYSHPGQEYNPSGKNEGSLAKVYKEEMVEIPLDAVKVMGSSTVVESMIESSWVEQDLLKKTTDAVKATAVILGDPMVESSMNIQIQNVSSRYSGIWYTKKVTHKFDTSEGYKMEVEFKKRSIPISVIKLHTRTNTAAKLMTTNEITSELLKSGDYNRLGRLQAEIRRIDSERPTYDNGQKPSLWFEQVGNTGEYNVYESREDFKVDALPNQGADNDGRANANYVTTIDVGAKYKDNK